MKSKNKWLQLGIRFFKRMSGDKIDVYAAQASFFLLLSMLPLIMLLLSLISIINIPKDTLITALDSLLPSVFLPLFHQIINEIFSASSGMLLSLTGVMAIWAASKSAFALLKGLYNIYHLEKENNFITLRLQAIIYTIVFLLAVVLTLVLMVFGNNIYQLITERFPLLRNILDIFFGNRNLICLCFLTFFFLLTYKAAGKSNYTIGDLFAGSLFSSLGWIVCSFLYSYFIGQTHNFTYIYGSLSTIIAFMLWLYACIYVVFIGAEINIFVHDSKKMKAT